jgi:uncharacterized protein with NRDE domain
MVIAANRDEFYERETAAATFWKDHPQLLAGRDLEAGGTWMGISRTGRISMLTNYRDPKKINPVAPSRGHLVSNFLVSSDPAEAYLQALQSKASQYNGFNLIAGNTEELWYLSNYQQGMYRIAPGIHGLSNHLLDSPWPKVERGTSNLKALLATNFTVEDVFALLYDDNVAADNVLPDTGVGLERERALSSMFIKTTGYGSRCSTVILIDKNDKVTFAERVYDLKTFSWSVRDFEFVVEH